MGVDYRLRTHKHIERQILLTFFKQYIGDNSDSFHYLGFGAEYYKDFIIIHENLNINKMVSIEKNTSQKNRYKFNKPYNCIDLSFGTAKDYLISTKFSENMIIWLDFTATFSEEIIEETILLMNSIKNRSIVLFTFNIERPIEKETYKCIFGEYIPSDHKKSDHSKKLYPELVKRTLDIMASKHFSARGLKWASFFNFTYSDNAKMQTIGYIIDSEESLNSLTAIWDSSPFFFEENCYELKIDTLTPNELLFLKRAMPNLDKDMPIVPWCNTKNESNLLVKQFFDVYKYYPLYGETIT